MNLSSISPLVFLTLVPIMPLVIATNKFRLTYISNHRDKLNMLLHVDCSNMLQESDLTPKHPSAVRPVALKSLRDYMGTSNMIIEVEFAHECFSAILHFTIKTTSLVIFLFTFVNRKESRFRRGGLHSQGE